MRLSTLVFAFTALIAQSTATVAADIPTETLIDYVQDAQGRVNNQALPMGRLMVSTRGNTTVMMSDNGRYKITGPITDTWLGIEIKTYEDARYSAEHLSLDNIKFKAEYLEPLNYGSGDQKVMVFLSPDDANSRALIRSATSLADDYLFQFIVIPSKETPLGVAHAFSCPAEGQAALQSLLSGAGMADLATEEGCSYDKLTNRILAFNMLGFDDLPAVLTPSSKLAIGAPEDGKSWSQFLKENTL